MTDPRRSAFRARIGLSTSTATQYAFAAAASLIAFAVRYLAFPGATTAPYLGFFVATAASAALGGWKPGVLAAVLGLLLAGALMPSGGWLHLADPSDPYAPLRYLASCGFAIFICETLLRARARAKRSEMEGRESEDRFRLIANSAPVLIWISGPDKLCTWFNEPWLKFRGRSMEQEVGNGWAEGVHPEDMPGCLDTYYSSFDKRTSFAMEYRLKDRHGNWRWVLDHGTPRFGPQGEFLGYIGSCIDIQQQKRVEEDLRWANADLEQFAFSASHDLREPIRNIAIYSEILAERLGATVNDENRRYLDFLTAGARRLDVLVTDLLQYTTVTKREDLEAVADAEAVLGTCHKALAALIEETGAEITHSHLPRLRIRDVHLEQILQNLISNALKYRSEEQPRVHISAERQGSGWTIAVADNGIGIEPEYQHTIFGLFKRLHQAGTYSGTGLGLAICQRIVHSYGGRIWVQSTPGQGATFFFTLPGGGDA